MQHKGGPVVGSNVSLFDHRALHLPQGGSLQAGIGTDLGRDPSVAAGLA